MTRKVKYNSIAATSFDQNKISIIDIKEKRVMKMFKVETNNG